MNEEFRPVEDTSLFPGHAVVVGDAVVGAHRLRGHRSGDSEFGPGRIDLVVADQLDLVQAARRVQDKGGVAPFGHLRPVNVVKLLFGNCISFFKFRMSFINGQKFRVTVQ